MNTQINGLPQPPQIDGKKFSHIEYSKPKEGEKYFSTLKEKWCCASSDFEANYYLVAIYEDTHRPDGTPMGILPLPDMMGYKVKCYTAFDMKDHYKEGDKWGVFHFGLWSGINTGNKPLFCPEKYYCIAHPIAQPTKMEDLFEEGNCWLHHPQRATSELITGVGPGYVCTPIIRKACLDSLAKEGYKWSNNPTTPYDEANRFVV